MISWLLKHLGVVTKYDLNEYARRFMAGDDLDLVGDVSLSPGTAMRIATVSSCVKVLSETIASLPLRVYKRQPGGGASEANKHPLYRLLYARPNMYQTSYEWIEQMVINISLRGNAICLKQRTGDRVTGLIPILPDRVTIQDYTNALLYSISDRYGKTVTVLSEDVLHIRGQCAEGYWGKSPVTQSKDAFELARRVQKYGNSVFNSGGAQRVLIKYPNAVGSETVERLRKEWEQLGRNSAKTAVLDNGGDATVVGMNADDAQYLETRKLNRSEICGIFRVPPHMVGDLEKATFSNIEKQDLFFVKHTIRPYLKRIEAALTRDLLDDPVRYFIKFNVDALLRGDIRARTESLKTQFMHGAISLDEWRDMEHRNPLGDEMGKRHFVPANLVPLDRVDEIPAADVPDGGIGGDDNEPEAGNEPKHTLEPIAKDIAQRLVNREIRELPRANSAERFFEQHRVYAYHAMRPLLEVAGIDNEDKRAYLASSIMSGLTPGQEINPDCRKQLIAALLMAEIELDDKSILWQARAAATLAHMEKQAAACSEVPND